MPSLPGRIVVLESDPARRRRLTAVLSGADGEVVAAETAGEARELLPASVVVGEIDLALETAFPDIPIVAAEGSAEAVAARVEAA